MRHVCIISPLTMLSLQARTTCRCPIVNTRLVRRLRVRVSPRITLLPPNGSRRRIGLDGICDVFSDLGRAANIPHSGLASVGKTWFLGATSPFTTSTGQAAVYYAARVALPSGHRSDRIASTLDSLDDIDIVQMVLLLAAHLPASACYDECFQRENH